MLEHSVLSSFQIKHRQCHGKLRYTNINNPQYKKTAPRTALSFILRSFEQQSGMTAQHDCFHCFPQLPTELRDEIWTAAAGSDSVHFATNAVDDTGADYRQLWETNIEVFIRRPPPASIVRSHQSAQQSLLRTCQASRRAVLRLRAVLSESPPAEVLQLYDHDRERRRLALQAERTRTCAPAHGIEGRGEYPAEHPPPRILDVPYSALVRARDLLVLDIGTTREITDLEWNLPIQHVRSLALHISPSDKDLVPKLSIWGTTCSTSAIVSR